MRTLRLSEAGTVILALLGGLGGAVVAEESEPAPAAPVARNLASTADGLSSLDVFAPSGPGPWPVVVIIPGAFQSRSAYTHLAETIASEGAVVYNVGVSMYEPFSEATRQIACAVRFARDTAADYGGDASSVTLVGHSAGAAIGMVVAMAGDEYARDCIAADGSALVDVLVGYEGVFDWATTDYDVINLVPLEEEDPDLWRALDPYAHIGGNPGLVVRLVHGDDADVAWYEAPRAVSVAFDKALLEAGYDSEVTFLEDAGHGAILDPEAEAVDVIVKQAVSPAE